MYMSDPTILPRVREYLEANSNEIYVDINALADELQSKYKEYSKRKRSAFRASVNKAYSILLRRCNLEKINGHVISEILSPKLPEPVADTSYDVQHPDNVMNRSLTELYTSSPLKKPSGNELIDISSDDSDNVTTTKSKNEKVRAGKYSQRVTGYGQEDVGKKRKYEQQTVGTETGKKKRGVTRVAEKVTCNLKSLGGMDKTLEEVCKIILHMRHPEVYKNIGVTPPRGLLLHGPPGCGKTLLAKSIAGELDIPLLKVTAPELVAGVSGESEERIRQLFEQAVQSAPCVLFIDEIDAITPSRQNAQKEMERRIVAQLLSCLDELNENGHAVLVIGASNRLDSIDAALRRAGRFDREISIGIPDIHARVEILKTLAKGLRLDEGFDFEVLASLTPGYVAADLLSLTREAAMVAINRSFRLVEDQNKLRGAVNGCENVDSTTTQQLDGSINANATITEPEKAVRTTLEEVLSWLHNDMAFPDEFLQNLRISMADFQSALKHVQPSAKREGFATIPDITWNDIGSLRDIREELQMAIVAPVRHAKEFYALGINVPTGVLLCGPPGCGKTLLAKAIANEAGINFISVKGPELLNMYVGESERAVRVCFERARNSAPCVIFFDELDALCPKRSESTEGSSSRVVNQMLTEMDGVEGRTGVFLLAASNRPDIIDPAVLRPGRLDKILFVDLPSALDRADILKAITKNGTVPPLAVDVSLEDIAKSEQCKGFTGADLAALIREASVIALKAFMTGSNVGERITVKSEHFLEAFSKIRPSVSDKDMRHYEKLRKLYSISKYAEEMECS